MYKSSGYLARLERLALGDFLACNVMTAWADSTRGIGEETSFECM